MTIILSIKNENIFAIHFNYRTATINVVQKFDQNQARTHRLGAIVILSFSENHRIFEIFLTIGS
jgi:hypothetical protein